MPGPRLGICEEGFVSLLSYRLSPVSHWVPGVALDDWGSIGLLPSQRGWTFCLFHLASIFWGLKSRLDSKATQKRSLKWLELPREYFWTLPPRFLGIRFFVSGPPVIFERFNPDIKKFRSWSAVGDFSQVAERSLCHPFFSPSTSDDLYRNCKTNRDLIYDMWEKIYSLRSHDLQFINAHQANLNQDFFFKGRHREE